MHELEKTIKYQGAKTRLDHLVRDLCGCGLRRAKTLISEGRIYIDGYKSIKQAKSIFPGQVIAFDFPEVKRNFSPGLYLVRRKGFWAAIYKPPGVHSDQGKDPVDAATLLPTFFEDKIDAILLNRLDQHTSGLLTVGLSSEAKNIYSRAQEAGSIQKKYVALVHGIIDEQIVASKYIDHARRRKVKVLNFADRDTLRHTWIFPVKTTGDKTLLRVLIKKGKRHQIRAHLSSIGHPIVGDALYGGANSEQSFLYLHHESIEWPDFKAECPAPWKDQI